MTKRKNEGVTEFVEGIIEAIDLPTTLDEWTALEQSPIAILAQQKITSNLDNMPTELLIDYYEFKVRRDNGGKSYKQKPMCRAIAKRFYALGDEMCDLDIDKIFKLVSSGFVVIFEGKSSNCLFSTEMHLHYLTMILNALINQQVQDKRKIIIDFFEKSMKSSIKRSVTHWNTFKYWMKDLPIPVEYHELLQTQAEMVLEEMSLGELKHKKTRYDYPGCRFERFVPLIDELIKKKQIENLFRTQNIKEFLAYDVIPENKSVVEHFCGLVRNMSLEDLEDAFRFTGSTVIDGDEEWLCVSLEEIPQWTIDILMCQYGDVLALSLREFNDNLKWLWERLARCPFDIFWDIFDVPLRHVLAKTSAQVVWEECTTVEEQLRPYLLIRRHKYICWFNRRIHIQTDIKALDNWIRLVNARGSKTETKVLRRAGEIWSAMTFEQLAKQSPDCLDYRLRNLLCKVTVSKLSDFLSVERSLNELFWAYQISRFRLGDDISWDDYVITPLEKLSREELIEWCERDERSDFIWETHSAFTQRLEYFAKRDINDRSLSPVELQQRANEIPRQFDHVRRILTDAVHSRIISEADIDIVCKYLNESILPTYIVQGRFFELLPDALRASTRAEIVVLYHKCPDFDQRVQFIALARQIAFGLELEISNDENRSKVVDGDVPF